MRTLRRPPLLSRSERGPSGRPTPILATAALGLAVILCGAVAGAADPPRKWRWTTAEQVVAIGDVHGAYEPLVDLLEQYDLISTDGRWTGGASHLVMLGDLVDRGPRSRDALDLVKRLQSEAHEAGGRVHVVLGNHEAMNLVGDLRYVSAAGYAAFAADEGPSEREDYVEKRLRLAASQNGDVRKQRDILNGEFPPGFFARHRAFSPDGEYGSWLLDQQFLIVVNGVVFVHGGLPRSLLEIEPERINTVAMAGLRAFIVAQHRLYEKGVLGLEMSFSEQLGRAQEVIEEAGSRRSKKAGLARAMLRAIGGLAFSSSGVLWYRGTSLNAADNEVQPLTEILAHLGASTVVVGHTPTHTGRITTRFGGAVVRADTGMLTSHYGGRASAVVLRDGRLLTFYPGEGTEPLSTRQWELATGSFAGVEEIEAFLESAPIAGFEELKTGSTRPLRVTLGDNGHRGQAIFKAVEAHTTCQLRGGDHSCRDSFTHEVAAYRLDRALGLDMVPPTVVREVNGAMGSLQLWVEGAINENNRRDEDLQPRDPGDFAHQLERARIFDQLILNPNRDGSGLLITTRDWKLHLIDHSSAFAPTVPDGLPRRTELDGLDRDLLEHLAALDADSLRSDLQGLLNEPELEALFARIEAMLDNGS